MQKHSLSLCHANHKQLACRPRSSHTADNLCTAGAGLASKRKRGDSWEFTIKRAKVIPRAIVVTFRNEADGDAWCRRIEALLDRGIVPDELTAGREGRLLTLRQLVMRYERDAPLSQKDGEMLRSVLPLVGDDRLDAICVSWVDALITRFKREYRYAPATIRAKIGALARCTNWGIRKGFLVLPDAPFTTLPEGYAAYTEDDAREAGIKREDVERDRRLDVAGKEEAEILRVIRGGILPRKQRPRVLTDARHFEALVLLALETAMRLREMFTITWDQVQLEKRFVWLDKTKNGDSRKVPLTTVAVSILSGLPRDLPREQVFPWWNGGTAFKDLKATTNYLSKLFADVCDAAGCPDFHFHDLRHEATSRLFERTTLPVETIMKITGHKDHRMFMRYLKLRESDIADKLW